MSIYILILLSTVQGITEFLPISSSLHISLISHLFSFTTTTEFTIGLHLGTLLAIVVYFYKDLYLLAKGFIRFLLFKQNCPNMVLNIMMASIATVIIGSIVGALFSSANLNYVPLIAFNLIVFGILLHLVDVYSKNKTELQEIRPWHSLIIGIAQAFALFPGVSRSGITITTSRWLQIDKIAAIKFAFLISIPVTLGALLMSTFKNDLATYASKDFILSTIITFAVALVFIRLLINFLSTHSFKIFMLYRIILGIILLVLFAFSFI